MNTKIIKILLGIAVVILSYGFIIYKIVNFEELHNITFAEVFNIGKNIAYIAIVLALMLFNWSVETIKWKILIQKISHINFFTALRIIFASITVGIVTPNRIGEIGGRIMFLKKGERTYGLLATSLGSFAQIITTTINGLAALLLLLWQFPGKTGINPILDKISAVIVLIILITFIWIYFKPNLIKPILLKFSFFQSRKEQFTFFSDTEIPTLLNILFLSFVRYSIFIVQFFLLLKYFNIEISFIQTYISVGLIYLLSTIIPTTTLVELGIRGSLSIFFIGMFTPNILGIVLSAFMLWIINLAIPSIFGSFFLIKRA